MFINTRIILSIIYFLLLPLVAIPYQIINYFDKKRIWQETEECDLNEQF